MRRAEDWNRGIIEEFRSNEGRVGGRFQGRTLLLLHHQGARTGTWRVNPLAYQSLDGGGWAVFASKGGSPRNPDWYHNLLANPRAKVEIRAETVDVVARVARGEERERIWGRQKRIFPGFAGYELRTDREIPVVILEPVGSDDPS
jgi:deazaflavin-dependent oxidoreductase (nitroreductase family)